MLMSGVGRQVRSGGQRSVRVSILHEKGDVIAQAVTLISNELQRIGRITERWSDEQRWTLLLTRLLRRRQGGKGCPVSPLKPRTCSADDDKPRDRPRYAPDQQVPNHRAHFPF